MLLPCGIDVFSGVEFVCCPAKKARKGQQLLQQARIKIDVLFSGLSHSGLAQHLFLLLFQSLLVVVPLFCNLYSLVATLLI